MDRLVVRQRATGTGTAAVATKRPERDDSAAYWNEGVPDPVAREVVSMPAKVELFDRSCGNVAVRIVLGVGCWVLGGACLVRCGVRCTTHQSQGTNSTCRPVLNN
jgi:hypothetical protein